MVSVVGSQEKAALAKDTIKDGGATCWSELGLKVQKRVCECGDARKKISHNDLQKLEKLIFDLKMPQKTPAPCWIVPCILNQTVSSHIHLYGGEPYCSVLVAARIFSFSNLPFQRKKK